MNKLLPLLWPWRRGEKQTSQRGGPPSFLLPILRENNKNKKSSRKEEEESEWFLPLLSLYPSSPYIHTRTTTTTTTTTIHTHTHNTNNMPMPKEFSRRCQCWTDLRRVRKQIKNQNKKKFHSISGVKQIVSFVVELHPFFFFFS